MRSFISASVTRSVYRGEAQGALPGRAGFRRQVVLNGLQDRTFLGAAFRQLQYRLCQARKELVVPQPAMFEVAVHLPLVAGLPELHEPVEAVDQRRETHRLSSARRGSGRGADTMLLGVQSRRGLRASSSSTSSSSCWRFPPRKDGRPARSESETLQDSARGCWRRRGPAACRSRCDAGGSRFRRRTSVTPPSGFSRRLTTKPITMRRTWRRNSATVSRLPACR